VVVFVENKGTATANAVRSLVRLTSEHATILGVRDSDGDPFQLTVEGPNVRSLTLPVTLEPGEGVELVVSLLSRPSALTRTPPSVDLRAEAVPVEGDLMPSDNGVADELEVLAPRPDLTVTITLPASPYGTDRPLTAQVCVNHVGTGEISGVKVRLTLAGMQVRAFEDPTGVTLVEVGPSMFEADLSEVRPVFVPGDRICFQVPLTTSQLVESASVNAEVMAVGDVNPENNSALAPLVLREDLPDLWVKFDGVDETGVISIAGRELIRLIVSNRGESVDDVRVTVEIARGRIDEVLTEVTEDSGTGSQPRVVRLRDGLAAGESLELDLIVTPTSTDPASPESVNLEVEAHGWVGGGPLDAFPPDNRAVRVFNVDTRPVLRIVREVSGLVISWVGGGRLQRATRPDGFFQDVPDATSPLTIEPSESGDEFYRVQAGAGSGD